MGGSPGASESNPEVLSLQQGPPLSTFNRFRLSAGPPPRSCRGLSGGPDRPAGRATRLCMGALESPLRASWKGPARPSGAQIKAEFNLGSIGHVADYEVER